MAISVGRSMKQLNEMARDLGIADRIVGTGKDGKVKKEDLILPIREQMLIQRYGSVSNTPKHLNLMLSLKSPMLAGRIENFKQEQQEEVWESDNWSMEQKLNGVRCFIINDGNGIHMYSRHNSDEDLLPICFTDKILIPDNCDLERLNTEFILDCEITSDNPNICTILDGDGVETATQLQAVTSILGSLPERAISIQRNNNLYLVFNSFDCIYYDGSWIMKEPLSERRKVAEEVIKSLEKIGFCIRRVPNTNVNKREFFKRIIDAGLEGTVCKRLDGEYIADTTRNFKGWVKCKRSLAISNSLDPDKDFGFDMGSIDFGDDLLGNIHFGDTVDVFVTGFEPGTKGSAFDGLVGSVCVSAFIMDKDGNMEKREVAKFSGITLEERKRMTEVVNGEPTLRPEYYGRVCEVDAQQVTKNGRFQHCVFLGWRWDKLPDSCIIEKDWMENHIF